MQHEQEQAALPQQAQRADGLLSPLPLNLLGLPFVTEAAKQAALAALGPGASPEHLTVQGLTELGLLQQGEPAAEQSPEYTSGDADLQIWLQERYDQQALYNAAQLYAQGLLGGQARRPVQPQQRQSPQRSPPQERQQQQPVSPQWPPIVLPVQQRGQAGSAAWVDAAVQQSFRQHSGSGFPYQGHTTPRGAGGTGQPAMATSVKQQRKRPPPEDVDAALEWAVEQHKADTQARAEQQRTLESQGAAGAAIAAVQEEDDMAGAAAEVLGSAVAATAEVPGNTAAGQGGTPHPTSRPEGQCGGAAFAAALGSAADAAAAAAGGRLAGPSPACHMDQLAALAVAGAPSLSVEAPHAHLLSATASGARVSALQAPRRQRRQPSVAQTVLPCSKSCCNTVEEPGVTMSQIGSGEQARTSETGAAKAAAAAAGANASGEEGGGQPCCWHCGTTTTSGHWRRHPANHQQLCGACGNYLDQAGQLPPDAVLDRRAVKAAEAAAAAVGADASGEEGGGQPCCWHCGTTTSGSWRRHPTSHQQLCGACGDYMDDNGQLPPAALLHRRAVKAAEAAAAAAGADASGEEGGGQPCCRHCGSTTTSGSWRRHPTSHQQLCGACAKYQDRTGQLPPAAVLDRRAVKAAEAAAAAAGADASGEEGGGQPCCRHCGSTTTSGNWRRHPISSQQLCNACAKYLETYGQLPPAAVLDRRAVKAVEAAAAAAGADASGEEGGGQPCCRHCGSTTTSGHWRRHPANHQQLCRACGDYMDDNGQLPPAAVLDRRRLSAAEKELMEERAPFLPPADESDVQQDTEQAAQVEQVAMQRLNECQQRLPQISRPAQRRAKKRRRAGMGGSDAGQRVQRARRTRQAQQVPVAADCVSTAVAESMQIMRRAGIPEGDAQRFVLCLETGDQGDSAFSVHLLRSLDATGATAAVRMVVELGLP